MGVVYTELFICQINYINLVLKSFSCMDPSDCGSTGVDCDSGICKCTAGGGVFPKECNETMGAEGQFITSFQVMENVVS